MGEVVAATIVIIMVNLGVICVYRKYQKEKREVIMKDLVNNEVSKYFKIAQTERGDVTQT